MEQAFANPLCLGNKKVGRIWTFSLPSMLTCPGASAWCQEHCYARRMESYRPNCRRAYLRNLLITENPDEFVRHTLESLPEDARFVRIHVGGDFHERSYCDAWSRICAARPDVLFWAFTRSWRVPALADALDTLRAQSNVQLFASTDSTMPLPPEGWRRAFIEEDPRAEGMPCKEQQQKAASCLACGYCFRKQEGNVVFKIH
jgi:hypothetical protein